MLCSQWFQGKRNPEADSLSRDADLSDADLTKLLLSSPECQLPSNFRIAPLPNEITSWIVSQARTLPVRKQLQRPLPRSTLSRGAAGLTEFLQLIHRDRGRRLPRQGITPRPNSHSRRLCPRRPTGQLFGAKVFATGCVDSPRHRASHVCARPSGTTSAGTQGKTTSASLHSFYSGSSEDDAASPTRPSGRRRRSPAGSSERSPPSGKRKRTVESGN